MSSSHLLVDLMCSLDKKLDAAKHMLRHARDSFEASLSLSGCTERSKHVVTSISWVRELSGVVEKMGEELRLIRKVLADVLKELEC